MEREVNSAPESFAKIFHDIFPYYLAYGMSYQEFWQGKPALVADYRAKHRIESRMKNEQAWLQGLYIYRAVSVAIHNKFHGKSDQPLEYPKEAIKLDPPTKMEREAERKKNIEAMRKMLEGMKAAYDARSNNNASS